MDTTNPFFRAVRYVFANEGGFVNDPLDPGGATNFGITQGTLASHRGEPVSADDVKALTQDEASEIYFDGYWRPLACHKMIQYRMALAIFDTGVLFGLSAAAVTAQRACRATSFPALKVDGHIGPFTLNALNATDPAAFLKAFHYLLVKRIDSIIEKRPTSAKFRDGWCHRIDKFVLKTFGG